MLCDGRCGLVGGCVYECGGGWLGSRSGDWLGVGG